MPDFIEIWRYPTPMGTLHNIYFCVVCGGPGAFLCDNCERNDDLPPDVLAEIAQYRRDIKTDEEWDEEPFGDFVTVPDEKHEHPIEPNVHS